MTAITDYTSLQAAIKTYFAGRDDWDVKDFIALGEARLFRILRVREMEKEATLVAASSVTLPTDYLEAISVFLETDPVKELEPVSNRVAKKRYGAAGTSTPKVYSVIGQTTMKLRPNPQDSDNIEMVYYHKPDPLSTTSTNAVLTAHPDAYLYAALIETAPYTGDDARLKMWSSLFTSTVEQANEAAMRSKNSIPRLSI